MAKRYSQPQGNAQIEWGNPITRGLVFAWVPATDSLTRVGSIVVRGQRYGQSIITDGSTNYEWQSSAPSITLDEHTLTSILTPTSTASSSAIAVAIANSGASNQFSMIGQGATSNNFSFRTRDDGAANDVEAAGTNGGWFDLKTAVVSGVRSVGGGYQKAFVNGAQVASIASGTSRVGTFNNLCIGGLYRGSIGLQWSGGCGLVLVHNRALSDAEIASISANPWQIFKGTTLILPAASVTLPTIGRPDSDGPTGTWTASTGGTLFGCIDEPTYSDVDYISVNSASTYTGTLNACAYPGGATQTVSFRGSSSAGSSVTLTFVQSGVTLLSWTQALTGTVTTYTRNLTTLTGDATAITFTIASS